MGNMILRDRYTSCETTRRQRLVHIRLECLLQRRRRKKIAQQRVSQDEMRQILAEDQDLLKPMVTPSFLSFRG
jgi:hypothetical protein